jgi:hypothetical protein
VKGYAVRGCFGSAAFCDPGVRSPSSSEDGKVVKRLPMPPEWNYVVRLYGPRPEILNAAWTFPEPQAAK